MQGKLPAVWQYHGVASITAAIEPRYNVTFLCEHIHNTAFAFVAALLPKYTDDFHLYMVRVRLLTVK